MPAMIALQGVDNFRDFGGYPTAGGRRLREGLLYRSASHARATEADLEAIAALRIGLVVDLRRQGEREREPSRRRPDFCAQVLHNDDEGHGDTWQEHIRSGDLSAESSRRYLIEYYRDAPFEPRHIDLFSRYFEALERTSAPVLIHCAAGKDRTGLLAALTHHLAGVHPDDAMSDYLATNDTGHIETRCAFVGALIAQQTGRTPSEAAVRVMVGVDPAYLQAAFDAIDERFGGADAYLDQALGVSAARAEAIRARLLA